MSRQNNDIPPEFICPIMLTVMQDPVIAADGDTYERSAISQWLHHNRKSPTQGTQLAHNRLVPNRALKKLIEDYQTGTLIVSQRSTVQSSSDNSQNRHTLINQLQDDRDQQFKAAASGLVNYLQQQLSQIDSIITFDDHAATTYASTTIRALRKSQFDQLAASPDDWGIPSSALALIQAYRNDNPALNWASAFVDSSQQLERQLLATVATETADTVVNSAVSNSISLS